MNELQLLNLVYLRKVVEPALTLAQAFTKVKAELVLAKGKLDVVAQLLNEGTPEVNAHDTVNQYLAQLEKTDLNEFNKMRRKPFEEQKAAAGA